MVWAAIFHRNIYGQIDIVLPTFIEELTKKYNKIGLYDNI